MQFNRSNDLRICISHDLSIEHRNYHKTRLNTIFSNIPSTPKTPSVSNRTIIRPQETQHECELEQDLLDPPRRILYCRIRGSIIYLDSY
jgi:hypothetical protein